MNRSFGLRTCTVLALSASIALAGCAAPAQNDANLSPAEQQLRAENVNFNRTVGEGAAIGALGGALIGALLFKNHAEGAAIGAAVGGAAGAGTGYAVANNNQAQARSEGAYNQQIAEAEKTAASYQQAAATSREVAREATAEARQLQAEYEAKTISAAQYRKSLQNYQSDYEVLTSKITGARKSEAALRKAAETNDPGTNAQMSDAANSLATSASTMIEQQQQISAVLDAMPSGS